MALLEQLRPRTGNRISPRVVFGVQAEIGYHVIDVAVCVEVSTMDAVPPSSSFRQSRVGGSIPEVSLGIGK
jgi:hypothetical protein